MVGQTIGNYHVVAKLGEGGMGEVYRARDVRLGRHVALKLLPDTFRSDADRLARFEREAQLLAALNHPRIGSIYGIEDSGGHRALVLELVEGPTLAERIAAGPLPLEESLQIARQVADALEAAHEKGIIHRDLKPSNIKLAADGSVKVLDFGLAKLHEPHAPRASSALSMSPTVMSPAMTGAGIIVGTAGYMSPEQARGRELDARADIWAFGCLLYEMISGRQVFAGGSVSDIVSEVLKTEPDWASLPPATPAAVRRLLVRCLQKDPARRLRHIADARLELDEALASGGETAPVPTVAPTRRPRLQAAAPWAVALLSLAAAALALGRGDNPAPDGPLRLELTIPEGVEIFTTTSQSVAIAPDGSRVAFVGVRSGSRSVFIRSLDSFEASPLRSSDGATTCFFSADGRSIGLIDAGGVVKTIDLANGTVSIVTGDASFISGVAWGETGTIVFVRNGALWQVTPGSAPTQLTTLDGPPRDREHASPWFLPGGGVLLFSAASGNDDWRIDALVLATGERRTVVERGTLPRYTSSGHLIYARGNELFAVPFDAASAEITGPSVKMLDLPPFAGAWPDLDVSLTGTLVSAPLGAQSSLVWVTRDGAEQPLSEARRPYVNPRVSPDGGSIVVQAGDIWIQDLRRSAFTRLAPTDSVAFPIWSASGEQVIYKTSVALRAANADGSGESTAIQGTGPFDYPGSMTADGQQLVFLRSSERTSFDVMSVPFPGGGEPAPILHTPVYEGAGRLSPDSRWLAYVANDSGQNEVYVRPYPGPDRRLTVSIGGGTQPVWDRGGRAVYYRNGNQMMIVDVSPDGQGLALSAPRVLFERQYAYGAGITLANYDVMPDGERFVMVKDESSAGRLNVIVNWRADLERQAPSDR